MQKRTLSKVVMLSMVGILTFAIAGAAYAQVSQSYDLGCWSVLSSGGGTHTSSSYVVKDVVGQVGAGRSSNSTYVLRSGYVQDWRTLGYVNPQPPDPNPDETNIIYMPYVARMISMVRTCPW